MICDEKTAGIIVGRGDKKILQGSETCTSRFKIHIGAKCHPTDHLPANLQKENRA